MRLQVVEELYSFDGHANSSIYHTWMRNGQKSGAYHAQTGSFGHDANSTFFVSMSAFVLFFM